MSSKQVTIEGIGSVTLYKRRGNRSLRLSIGASGEVRVSLPAWLPYKAGEQFARSKASWIEVHQARFAPGKLAHGQRVGKAHRLVFEPKVAALKVSTRVRDGEVRITHPHTYSDQHATVQQAAQKACIKALRSEAERLLPQRLRTLAEQTGFVYKDVGVKQLKSRWGSCSSSKEITLNLFLMQLPWQLIDYVLLHELTHTKVMRHGAPFWQELERHAPNAKQLRREISKHQPILTTSMGSV